MGMLYIGMLYMGMLYMGMSNNQYYVHIRLLTYCSYYCVTTLLGFTQYVVIGYACCMLVVFLRVQMSILGGIMCLQSEVSVIPCVVVTVLLLLCCNQIRKLIQ